MTRHDSASAFILTSFIIASTASGCSSAPSTNGNGDTSSGGAASGGLGSGGSTGEGPASGGQSGTGSSAGANGSGGSDLGSGGGTGDLGSGGDVGDLGSGGLGTGGDSAQSTGCTGANIYCDTFESGSIDTAQWAVVGAAPAWDGTKGHSGTGSVRVEELGQTGRFLKHTSGFPAGGVLYFRAYMNFENPTTSMSGHTGFIVGASADTNGDELRFGQSSPGCVAPNQLLDLNHIPSDDTLCSSGYVSGGNPADAPDPNGYTLQGDTWYCVETLWDKSMGEFRIWIDGTEIETLHALPDNWCMATQDASTCPAPSPWPMDFQMVKFGNQVYNGGNGTIWYDDVALSTEPIGCDD